VIFDAVGSIWGKWDLHSHTPASFDYGRKNVTNRERNAHSAKRLSGKIGFWAWDSSMWMIATPESGTARAHVSVQGASTGI
jgi:hypothetical protein